MAEQRRPSPDDVRALVQRVVDATLAGSTLAAASTGPAGASSRSAPSDGRVAIAIGADHGGWQQKDAISTWLREQGYAVHDCGTHGPDAVDYPDFAHAVAKLVADGTCRWGIVIDGAGIGSAMTANKVPGIRAANCHDISSARNSREHNYANVLTLGARFVGDGLAIDIVRTWLETDWGAERHGARVDKITRIERSYLGASGGKDR